MVAGICQKGSMFILFPFLHLTGGVSLQQCKDIEYGLQVKVNGSLYIGVSEITSTPLGSQHITTIKHYYGMKHQLGT